MNLLLSRNQRKAAAFSLVPLRIGSGVMFNLHAELELDEEEQRLLKTYDFTRAPLVASDAIEDIKKAYRPALLLGVLSFIPFWIVYSFWAALPLAVLFTVIMTFVYFNTMREQILVSDLLDGGRTFRCDSIVELIHKEAFLEGICEYLRQVLESAKHWTDREAVPIKPLGKADAKLAILKATRA